MTHAVVAFPVLAPADRAWIDDVRARHPNPPIAPHVSLVFPHAAPDDAALVAHVRRCAGPKIACVFRCCIAMPEPDGRASLFLVPDEGFAAIARLHDALYTGLLAGELRHDLPFVPHLTLGVVAQPARPIVDALNRELGAISATLDALDVLADRSSVARVPLY